MRLLIVDDHEVVRRGVRSLLLDQPGYEVCGEAVNGQEALEKARELKPDVIVMDVSMPKLNGLEATSLIRSNLPECEIVLLTQHEAQETARQALKAGARGYVIKSSMARDLISAVERAYRHEYSYDPSFAGMTGPTTNADVQEVIQRSAALEQALRESEQLYRSTFEVAAVGVSHVAPDGRWLRVNRKLCEIVGYSERELLDLTFQQMTHPNDLPADLELTKKILNGELDTFSMDKRYIRKDGSPVWVNLTVAAVRHADRKLKHFVSIIEDISARKQTQKAIEDSEGRFRLAEAAAQVGSWEWDPASGERKLSPELRRILAVDDSDEGVRKWGERIQPDDRPKVETLMKESSRTGEMDFEYRYLHPDLGLRWLHSKGRRLGNESPMFGVVLDVTERKQAQAAAGHATGLLAAIVDSSDDAIVSKDLNGIINSWNNAAERIFGYTAAEAVGKHISLIIPQDRFDEAAAILNRIKSGERVDHFETLRRRRDGTLLDISLTISPVKDESGRTIGASKVARDITQRKRAEADLRKSEEQFRKLSETLDAEVRARTSELEERNTEILTQSEQLRELSWRVARAQEEERRHIARELHDSAGQTLTVLSLSAAELVNEAETVAPALAKRGEALQALIQQLHREIRTASYLLHPPLLDETGISSALGWYVQGLMERAGLSITLDIASDFGRLPSDMELVIFRLVQECLTNIHRHSESKTAAIRIFKHGDDVRVEVADQGIGIAPDRLAKVQAGSSGVGIRGMAERLLQFRGDMKIESSGSGTTVIATIPLVKETRLMFEAEPSQTAV